MALTTQTLQELHDVCLSAIQGANTSDALDQLTDRYFSRKHGELTALLRQLKSVSDITERKRLGELANTIKADCLAALQKKRDTLQPTSQNVPKYDLTLPAVPPLNGHIHPLRRIQEELVEVFYSLGFSVAEGNELEDELYCFEYLNIPATHPARDLQDTFFVDVPSPTGLKHVMRTHTSNMQVRLMQQAKPPLRYVVPGRVFRNEAIDASHEHTFYQMEGFVVDQHISIGHLTYVLKMAMSRILQADIKIRLRPGYFPYVEPGFEADCSCVQCGGKGCSVCKHTGWVEMLGCGMIHPKVFAAAGYAPREYSGFAFGIGLNRLAMMKYKIDDIRWLMSNDMRFLKQFP